MNITDCEFPGFLKNIAARDTSADPDGWTVENPLWGHCAVAALLGQDLFGGEIVRGSLENYPQYSHLHTHYWNRFGSGIEIDFTQDQYPYLSCRDLAGEVRSRERVLSHPDTVKRYNLLKERFNNITR